MIALRRALAAALVPACIVVSSAGARASDVARPAPTPTAQATLSPVIASRPAYQLNRDEEDWSLARGPQRRADTFDALKYVPISPADPNAYVTYGADVREFYEHYFNQNWSAAAGSNGYLLQRYLFSFDAHVDRVRLYTELESALVGHRNGGPGPNNEDGFDPVAGYLSYAIGGATGSFRAPLAIEAGRFELAYGGERLLTANNGPGIRHSFDGARAIARSGAYRTDVFAAYGVSENAGELDDSTNAGQSLIGAYVRRERPGTAIVEGYLLSEHRKSVAYQRGVASETRDTVGTRVGDTWGRVDTEFEAAYQFGTFGAVPISAFTLAGTTGYTFVGRTVVARLYSAGGIGSGDHGGSTLGTFRPPTFKAAYLGAIAAVGPENSVGIQSGVSLLFDRRINAGLEYSYFERQSRSDGLYGVAGNLLAPGTAAQPATIGSTPLVNAGYAFDRHLSLQTFYQRYGAGAFLQTTRMRATTGYYAAVLDAKF
jgi:hypothetical protein